MDDSKNWKRAFHDSKPPKGVTIVHSLYRCESYVPREEDWVFELKLTPEVRKMILDKHGFKHPESDDAWMIEALKKEQPDWFLPKPMENYEVWIWAIDSCTFEGAFEDKQSGNFFVAGAQL